MVTVKQTGLGKFTTKESHLTRRAWQPKRIQSNYLYQWHYLLAHWQQDSVQTLSVAFHTPCAPGPACPQAGWPQCVTSSEETTRHSANRENDIQAITKNMLRYDYQQSFLSNNPSHLHVLYLPQVSIFGCEQQSSGFIQLGLHTQRLIVQQRELWLEALVLWRLLQHFLWYIPQIHLQRDVEVSKKLNPFLYSYWTFIELYHLQFLALPNSFL